MAEEIQITSQARMRMSTYAISEQSVRLAIELADLVLSTYGERKIYEKRIDSYILRIIVEEHKGLKRVITVYPARADRYATI